MKLITCLLAFSTSFSAFASYHSTSEKEGKPYVTGTISCVVGGTAVGLAALVDSVPVLSFGSTALTYFSSLDRDS